MKKELSIFIERLKDLESADTDVILWGSPVLSFGNLNHAKIATIGLNPSNKEFVNSNGEELTGINRRFPTLGSLGLSSWSEVEDEHIESITEYCFDYFKRNPYDGWFKKLDQLISGTSVSYYFPSLQACHLDLVPFATSCKWTDLPNNKRNELLELCRDSLGLLLKDSQINIILLNGRTVIDNFEKVTNIKLDVKAMPEWNLPRKDCGSVAGFAYEGLVNEIGGFSLGKEVKVLGFNHNIQSSYGVTKNVVLSIRDWITVTTQHYLS